MATKAYAQRVSPEKIAAFRAGNPGATEAEARRALRGHATTAEHGGIPESEPHYTRDGKLDRTMYETTSGQRARSVLAGIAKTGGTVSIECFTKLHNEVPLVYVEEGNPKSPQRPEQVSARWLTLDKANANRVGSERNLKRWLEKQWMPASGVPSPGFRPRDITRIRIFVHFR